MNAALLLEHYGRIADAPDAIARLRRFVLELAVRGKLVEQDASDEPAPELLVRILAERARLVKSGEAQKSKDLADAADDADFDLPPTWAWTRLGSITSYIQRGKSPKYAEADGVPVISQKCVQWSGLNLGVARLITRQSLEAYENIRFLRDGDLLWNSTGTGTIGRIVRLDGPPAQLVCDSHVTVVRCLGVNPEYVRIWLRSDHVYGSIEGRAAGSTNQVELTGQMAIGQVIPLPPVTEQHRIVAKVEELMTLCDQLEAARAEREAARDTFTLSALAKLNTPDSETFGQDARFALSNLAPLTTRPDQIEQLRQTILNLAVRGKLVAQDPNDEPSSSLLNRIAAENQNLMLEKGIRAQKPGLPADSFEEPVELPSTWQRVYLQDIAYQITDGTHLTPKYTEAGKPFLSAQNVKPFRFMPEKHRFVSEADFQNYRANRRPERGDILMTRVGAGIGEAAVLNSDFEFAFYVSLCLIKLPNRLVSADYLALWLNSPEGRESSTARTYGKGASQGNLNLSLIRTFNIPLPPLAEQHRIVAEVNALMALCDQLEANIATGEQTRSQLLESVLHHALELA